eukprot:scaffold70108_cov49-Prasinocladus_malaysianus.AAC.3
MSFGMFQPKETKCSILDITNIIKDLGDGKFSYDIHVPFEVAEGPAAGLKGYMYNKGTCWISEDPGDERGGRLGVSFTGGTMSPIDKSTLSTWNSVFGDEAVPAPGLTDKVGDTLVCSVKRMLHQQLSAQAMLSKAVAWLMSSLLGIDKPLGGADQASGTQEFSMNRAPQGWLDVIFMDEDLRVTRGNRGSIVAVQRKA